MRLSICTSLIPSSLHGRCRQSLVVLKLYLRKFWQAACHQYHEQISKIYKKTEVVFVAQNPPINIDQQFYSRIGMGVYQGSPVIFQIRDTGETFRRWVVGNMRIQAVRYEGESLLCQLCQMVSLVNMSIQFDHLKKDLPRLDEIRLETDCQYSKLLSGKQSSADAFDNEQCPSQLMLQRVLEQSTQLDHKLETQLEKYRFACPLIYRKTRGRSTTYKQNHSSFSTLTPLIPLSLSRGVRKV
jgi:hypothetical protein